MIKKICFMALLLVLLSVTGCNSPVVVDEELVGHWFNMNYQDTLVFTDDGKMGMGYFTSVEDITYKFRYTAVEGSGEFWLADNAENKASFTYSITEGSILQFNVAGGDPSVGGDSGEYIAIVLLPRDE